MDFSRRAITQLASNNKNLINGALFSLFSFINKGLVFLLLLVLANYIDPGEYGYLSLFSTLLTVLGFTIALCSEGYVSFAYFREGKGGIGDSCSGTLAITIPVSLLLILITSLAGDTISHYLHLSKGIILCGIIICTLNVIYSLHLNILRIREKVVEYGMFSMSFAIFNFVVSIVFVSSLLMGWEGRVYANLLGIVLFGGIALYYLIKNAYLHLPSGAYVKKMLYWSIPLIPHSAVTFIRQGLDRYIIDYNYTIADVGIFSFAMNMANIIMMIGIGFNQSNSVDISKVLGDKALDNKQKIIRLNKQRRQLLAIYIVITAMVMLSVPVMLNLFLPQYKDSTVMFLILAIYGFLCCFYFLYTNYLFYYAKTRQIMYITFASAIVHLILSLILTPLSLYLTCTIYVVSQALICIYIYKKANRELKKQLA